MCLCLCITRCFLPSTVTTKDFCHFKSSLLDQSLNLQPFVFGSTRRHTSLKCLPRVLITISFHVVLWKRVLPIVIFHFSPAWIQVWSSACVYAVRGDAWCQTSTPHPNNGLLLCSPLLGRLIIRIVSPGEICCNMSLKLLWGPSPNSRSHSALTLTFSVSLGPLCKLCAIWWLY